MLFLARSAKPLVVILAHGAGLVVLDVVLELESFFLRNVVSLALASLPFFEVLFTLLLCLTKKIDVVLTLCAMLFRHCLW